MRGRSDIMRPVTGKRRDTEHELQIDAGTPKNAKQSNTASATLAVGVQ